MDKSTFKGKKIIFYGPADTSDKKILDIRSFDYIIITNNMLDIFFSKYDKNLSCKIIHLVNQLYSLNYIDTIKRYSDNIPSNIRYTRMVCDFNKNITMYRELHDVLYK